MSGSHPTPPSSSPQDRRTRRSADPLVALHYQLASTRARGELDAVVLADPSGVVVAGAGSWPACEELAAYAPLLAEGTWGSLTDTVSSRVESLRAEVQVLAMSVEGQDVLLCVRRQSGAPGARPSIEEGQAIARNLDQAAAGITRILKVAA